MPRACAAAAAELTAARKLIAGYEDQIVAFDARLDLARQELKAFKEAGELQSARAKELEAVIAAEREAKARLIELKDIQAQRITKLEKSLSRSRKLTLIASVAAGVAILITAVQK